jgi:ribonuclease inhibitor
MITLSEHFKFLSRPDGPWIVRADGEQLSALLQWLTPQSDMRVFVIDGRLMRTAQGFYDEISEKLAFPDYFGRNLDALYDCLTDPDVMEGDGFVLILNNGDQLLREAGSTMLEGVLGVFNDAGAQWARLACAGEVRDHPAVPFHVVIERVGAGDGAMEMLARL